MSLDKLKEFDNYPDDAVVSDAEAAALLGLSLETVKRKNPVPRRQVTKFRHGRRVGDLRKLIRGEIQPAA